MFEILLLFTALAVNQPSALPEDSVVQDEERHSNQNVLLNASSTSQPRFISLGMPQWGTRIMDDGLPASVYGEYFPGYWSWHNGLGTESMSVTTLDESALQMGLTGFFASSISRTGAEKLTIAADYRTNQYGRHEIDLNMATPLGRGWSISLNVYQDLDRGSNHLDVTYLQQHIQYYKAGAQKKFAHGRGLLRMSYQFMDSYMMNFPYGPFIFVGDGSIREYNGFNLGRDQYLPSTPTFDYMDVKTGEIHTKRYEKDCSTPMHSAVFSLDYDLAANTKLNVITRLKTGHTKLAEPYLSSIDNVASDDGYTYTDGKPYSGEVQTCYLMHHDGFYTDWLTTAKLSRKSHRNSWQAGLNVWQVWSGDNGSSSNFAYEAKKDPLALLYNGENYYVHNTSGLYFDGRQTILAGFFQDHWSVTPRFDMRAGIRVEYSGMRGDASNNIDDNTNNTRVAGWNLSMAGVTKTSIDDDYLNGALTLVANWRLTKTLSLEVNAIATQSHSEMWQYYDASLPSTLPKRNYLVRAGINYRNSWIDLQTLLTYITQRNNYQTTLYTHELKKAAGGYPAGYKESLFVPSTYSMEAFGWTTDVLLKPFKGFSFHGFLTIRDPRYSNFKFTPVFSDGYQEIYDFSDKQIITTSKIEMELEPSYEIGKWRVWMSARYYSRQYVNITNSLYFNPRWETFCGVSFKANDHISFDVNIVNFLNQKGASAGIQAASLATDGSLFHNYLTSGTYIRPFTLEIGTKIRL